MVQSSSISITPAQHADNHRTGGSDPLTGAVGIDAMAPLAHYTSHAEGGTDDLDLGGYVVSDTVLYSNDPVRQTDNNTLVKVKEIEVDRGEGNFRVKFWMGQSADLGTSQARVYVNGVATGTLHSIETDTYVQKTDDLTGIVVGDLIQIYANSSLTAYTLIKEMDICGDVEVYTVATGTNQDP